MDILCKNERACRAHRIAGLLIAWAALSPVLAVLAALCLSGSFLRADMAAIVLNGVFYPLLVAAPTALACAYGRRMGVDGGIHRPAARHILLGLACGACMWPGASVIAMLGSTDAASQASTMDIMLGLGFVPSALVFAAIPALAEELLARGFLYGTFSNRGPAWGVAASSACFALLHGDPVQAAYAAYCGLFLGALRMSTGSVWAGIAAHMLFNLSTVAAVFLREGPADAAAAEAASGGHTAVWLVLFAVAGAVLAWALCRAEARRHGAPGRKPGWPAVTAWSAGGAAAAAFFAAAFRWGM